MIFHIVCPPPPHLIPILRLKPPLHVNYSENHVCSEISWPIKYSTSNLWNKTMASTSPLQDTTWVRTRLISDIWPQWLHTGANRVRNFLVSYEYETNMCVLVFHIGTDVCLIYLSFIIIIIRSDQGGSRNLFSKQC